MREMESQTAETPGSQGDDLPENVFLKGSLALVFARTAAPIILIMLVNGLFNLVDAWFLGVFVGAEALTAVTLMFPLFMMLIAMATIVTNGFASVMARLLGAREPKSVLGNAFAGAVLLSLIFCAILVGIFLLVGGDLVDLVARGSETIARQGYLYIAILVLLSPITFVEMLLFDLLRSEGRVSFMTMASLSTILLNVVFNYILIAKLDMGVAGSALGTIAAQFVAALVVIAYRCVSPSILGFSALTFGRMTRYWRDYLALGVPPSLGYLGVSLSSAAVIYCLQLWSGDSYEATVGAYGITTRLMTFSFLPLLGLAMAFQTVVGNNFGAQIWTRTDASLKLAVMFALVYCVIIESGFLLYADVIGYGFVDDAAIAGETGRILPYMVALFFLFGPSMMLAYYFQATGDAGRSAAMNLSRTYAFGLPLTFVLPFAFGEQGIWFAGPLAEILMLGLALYLMVQMRRLHGLRWGLFRSGMA
ncbi:MATE family efflux transporter [Nitratireductor sp. XY-223]|uniref:MATE family efflux transporter n=1 Tax=Nitratireductor sp. XY-223 TaxID=2561926 RepID=UPI001FF0031B|nr:MATE family efflux transporter [Nitratireductor sp. XY-223]